MEGLNLSPVSQDKKLNNTPVINFLFILQGTIFRITHTLHSIVSILNIHLLLFCESDGDGEVKEERKRIKHNQLAWIEC